MTLTELKEQIEREFDPEGAPDWAIHAVNLMRVLWGDVDVLRDELSGWQHEYGGNSAKDTLGETDPNRQLPEPPSE